MDKQGLWPRLSIEMAVFMDKLPIMLSLSMEKAVFMDKSKLYKKKQLSIDSCFFDVGVL